ncbi:uncharacterized protein AMSG_03944 [Thecamonas trahens ATCC 50062]|uniref:TLC domain-containing protein n=1 Tax=Thecamonas trahens ATCC 50062 TaxID=461836 RepID=A0A0L0D8U5_THETB|nr:hypothetical protein AMSG_03944 [Thecamonas trahens ATCC 50062]KNC47713.1 hypothetical protein AMSG_03944 [Thecamonas trahens ATCC 50062]|eukprot:XP_013759195.1 hypothetical protein AMSG_03944 [Thecamonas trahens ATCC 50062]
METVRAAWEALVEAAALREEDGFSTAEVDGAWEDPRRSELDEDAFLASIRLRYPWRRIAVLSGGWLLGCVALHGVAHGIIHASVAKDILAAMPPEDANIYLAEHVVSWVHGAIMGIGGLWAVAGVRLFDDSVTRPYPPILDSYYACHLGYTLYDLVTMALHGGETPSMWAHHIAGVVGSALMPCLRSLAFIPTAFFITELTVLPQNVLWFCQRLQVDRSSLFYRGLLFARAVFYLAFRAPALFFVVLYAWRRGLRPARFLKLPGYVQALVSVILGGLGFLNTQWSQQVVTTYITSELTVLTS